MRTIRFALATVFLSSCWISTAGAAPVPKGAPLRVEVLPCSDCLQIAIDQTLAICAYDYGEVFGTPAECSFLENDPEMANIINFHLGYFNSTDFDTRIDAFGRLLTACNGSGDSNGFKRYLEEIVRHLDSLENQGRCSCAELRYQGKTVADKCVDADRVEK